MELIKAYCLSCHAQPGEPCRDRNGRSLPQTHARRVDLTLLDRCNSCGAATGEPCVGPRGGAIQPKHIFRRTLDETGGAP